MAALPNTLTADTIITNNQTLLHLNMTNVTKLTPTNYLMWKLQVHALVDGHGLIGHLYGSTVAPSPQVINNNVTTPNPDFVTWQRQDKLIYSALLGSMSLAVQPILSRTTPPAQIWTTLAATYAKPSWGHIKQLHDQLKHWTKGSKPIDEFIQGFTTRFDTLATLGKPVAHEEQVDYILEGLPDDYRPVADQIEGRDVPPTLTYIHERLLNQEAKILSKAASSTFPVSANLATQRNNASHRGGHYNNGKKHYNNNNNSYGTSSNYQSSRLVRSDEHRGHRPYLGRFQICNTHGHSARWCPQYRSRSLAQSPNQSSPFRPWQPRANLAIG
ncbi:PREDICTED: uncharacterized protein LOC104748916 [Camelina sativa]|uniref:Uncharacterized protein LOC104748916 n=1 Tax=Camelina sativa TaxID=90675 RepID=A0ABM0WBS9_CAMSA|nr:PREDICTED: uncharacterized protein LOC104748916 [Camelina sativa]